MSELEISWASGEREELECTKSVIDEDEMEPERGLQQLHLTHGDAYCAPSAVHNITPGATPIASPAASKENLNRKCTLCFIYNCKILINY